jgi:phage shock protein A
MGILDRLSTLVKSNVNDLIDHMQDPGKEIDQLILDMEDAAGKARQEVAACIANEKLMQKRLADLADESTSWEGQAEKALRAGNEELAREALRRKATKDADRIEAEKALAEQQVAVERLKAGLVALDARVKDVKLRQGTLRAKARAAHGENPLSAQTSAFGDFDRMSSKIEALEAEGALTDELSGQTAAAVEAEGKLRQLSEDQALDDALAALKKKVGG